MNLYEKNYKQFLKDIKDGKRLSPIKAIRCFCLDCMGYQSAEIEECGGKGNCVLYPFRMGKNETGKKK